MKRNLILALALILVFGLPAWANQVELTFTGTGSNSSNGEPTYPYYFTVGNSSNVALMCDTLNNHISHGEYWQATIVPILDAGTSGYFHGVAYGSLTSQQTYDVAGLLYLDVLKNPADANIDNWAVWDLFTGGSKGPSGVTGLIGSDESIVKASGFNSSVLADVVVYDPVAGSQPRGDGTPQEFIGGTAIDPVDPVPEPASLLLLGTGLIGLAGAVRRRVRL